MITYTRVEDQGLSQSTVAFSSQFAHFSIYQKIFKSDNILNAFLKFLSVEEWYIWWAICLTASQQGGDMSIMNPYSNSIFMLAYRFMNFDSNNVTIRTMARIVDPLKSLKKEKLFLIKFSKTLKALRSYFKPTKKCFIFYAITSVAPLFFNLLLDMFGYKWPASISKQS